MLPSASTQQFATAENAQDDLVITSNDLNAKAIKSLAEGDVLAIKIPNFYSHSSCLQVADRLIHDERTTPYPLRNDAREIDRWGLVYLSDSSADSEQYHEKANDNIIAQRQLCQPNVSPIDLLRLRLEEVWPAGATLECFDNKPMSVGFARLFKPTVEAKPHLDSIKWVLPNCLKANQLHAQISANIYLQTPAVGGELELWSWAPSMNEYGKYMLTGSYGLDRTQLPKPSVIIKPELGDLILFCSTNVHAVRPCPSGLRITFSCSIGYRSINDLLTYWS